jgi:hypothetical protein
VTAIKCWVCLGTGLIKGPIYTEKCTNPHCPHQEGLAERVKVNYEETLKEFRKTFPVRTKN